MAHPSKRRGDKAEREVAALLADELGVHARRAFGAGRTLDEGDLVGVPNTVVQVCNRQDVAAAVRQKPVEAERQRANAGADFAATFVRLRGGEYRVVLTVPQFLKLWREAQPVEKEAA